MLVPPRSGPRRSWARTRTRRTRHRRLRPRSTYCPARKGPSGRASERPYERQHPAVEPVARLDDVDLEAGPLEQRAGVVQGEPAQVRRVEQALRVARPGAAPQQGPERERVADVREAHHGHPAGLEQVDGARAARSRDRPGARARRRRSRSRSARAARARRAARPRRRRSRASSRSLASAAYSGESSMPTTSAPCRRLSAAPSAPDEQPRSRIRPAPRGTRAWTSGRADSYPSRRSSRTSVAMRGRIAQGCRYGVSPSCASPSSADRT